MTTDGGALLVITDLADYSSQPPADTKFNENFKAWRFIAFMRWITLLLGPVAIILDNYLEPWLTAQGFPNIITMEDLSQWLVLDVFRLGKWIDLEEFLEIYYHVNVVSCVLFVVFVLWFLILKSKTIKSARDMSILQEQMRGGI